MAVTTWPAWLEVMDDKGYVRRLSWWLRADGFATAKNQGALQGGAWNTMSNGNLARTGGVYLTSNADIQYGGTALYPSCADAAEFVFSDVLGNYHRYRLPAPSSAMFLADGETLNLAYGPVVTLAGLMVGSACGRSGSLLSALVGGRRVRRAMQRRINAYTRGPALAPA